MDPSKPQESSAKLLFGGSIVILLTAIGVALIDQQIKKDILRRAADANLTLLKAERMLKSVREETETLRAEHLRTHGAPVANPTRVTWVAPANTGAWTVNPTTVNTAAAPTAWIPTLSGHIGTYGSVANRPESTDQVYDQAEEEGTPDERSETGASGPDRIDDSGSDPSDSPP